MKLIEVAPTFRPNLAQILPNLVHLKTGKVQQCWWHFRDAPDSQKHTQTQNLEPLKSKIAEIF